MAARSFVAATCSRYHRRMVSGDASEAISARALRPSALPFSASERRSASVNRMRLGPRRARKTRFSARRYSIAACCRRFNHELTIRMRNCRGKGDIGAEPSNRGCFRRMCGSATFRKDFAAIEIWDTTG